MTESVTTNSTWRYVHGEGAADTSDYPTITVNFDVVCTREEGSSTVKWKIQNMDWDYWGANNYGYYLRIYVAVNPVNPYDPDYDTELVTILEKETLTSSYWWNYINIYNPDYPYQQFTSTTTSGTCYIYAEVDNCCRYDNNTYPCYYTNAGSHFCLFDSFSVDLPTYAVEYNVSYNGDGGAPVPDAQKKSSLSPLTLSSVQPTKSVTITYHKNPVQVITPNRAFGNWLCNKDGNLYAPGGTYSRNEDCTMTAQWGDASFIPPALDNAYFTLTYNYNGGSGSPSSTALLRANLGYNTNSGASTATYVAGQTYTTQTNLNLYQIYGNATVVYNNLPHPTKSGYAFKGWYKDAQLTQLISADYQISGNTQIYAGWRPLPVHKRLQNNTWDNNDRVYKWNGSAWVKVPVYKCEDGSTWTNLSQ